MDKMSFRLAWFIVLMAVALTTVLWVLCGSYEIPSLADTIVLPWEQTVKRKEQSTLPIDDAVLPTVESNALEAEGSSASGNDVPRVAGPQESGTQQNHSGLDSTDHSNELPLDMVE